LNERKEEHKQMSDGTQSAAPDKTAGDMRQYFSGIDRRIAENPAPRRVYHIDIMGRFITLIFVGMEPDACLLASLRRVITDEAGETGETFYIWTGSIADYAPQSVDMSEGRWVYQRGGWKIILSLQFGYFKARFDLTGTSYICFAPCSAFPPDYISHPFVTELHWWARRHRMLLTHSAAVGAGGQGVLISAPGGKGKSTLALACLLAGMDYVADDYLLLDEDGPPTARPIYSTGYLNPDSLELLPALKRHIIGENAERGKLLIDLTPFEAQFVPSLTLKAIVFPELCGDSEPSVVPAAPAKPLIQMISSTAKQNREERNPDFFLALLGRTKGLPAYQIRLTRDVEANASALEAFCRIGL
jgi:hypothetical protein